MCFQLRGYRAAGSFSIICNRWPIKPHINILELGSVDVYAFESKHRWWVLVRPRIFFLIFVSVHVFAYREKAARITRYLQTHFYDKIFHQLGDTIRGQSMFIEVPRKFNPLSTREKQTANSLLSFNCVITS